MNGGKDKPGGGSSRHKGPVVRRSLVCSRTGQEQQGGGGSAGGSTRWLPSSSWRAGRGSQEPPGTSVGVSYMPSPLCGRLMSSLKDSCGGSLNYYHPMFEMGNLRP